MSDKDNKEFVMGKIIDAQQIMEKLFLVAEEDDEITSDERELLDTLANNIDLYKKLMERVVNQSSVSDEELENIHITEKKIVQDASSQAFLDGEVTSDERKLLEKLIAIFEDINEVSDR